MSRYELARCELYNHKRHNMENDTNRINQKILCMDTLETDEYMGYINTRLFIDSIYFVLNRLSLDEIKSKWESGNKVTKKNWIEFCDTFKSSILDPFYNKINLVKKEIIVDENGNEWTTCIIKTYWISIIQRAWKNIYMKRKEIIRKRMNPNNLHHRQIVGKWPSSCHYLPSISDINL